jgi:hydroxymethylpyrimidine/phosphomethylpyrimidine kinase
VKLGLVPDAASALALGAALAGYEGPVVVDPVRAASAGGALSRASRDELWPLLARATLVTPNASELAGLADRDVADMDAALVAARSLCARGLRWVLVKGGHLPDPARCTDVLVSATETAFFEGPRLAGPSPRGTGCALASAVAVGLARGLALPAAVGAGKTWLAAQIAAARPYHLPSGVWHLP